jgi:hypothetical protein
VAQLGSKVPDDAPVDDDPELLNFATTVPWIGCWMRFLLQKYWSDLGKPDSPVFATLDAGLPPLYLAMRMLNVTFG